MKSEIHISDIRAFKQCRRKWAWASPLRANLEPNVPYVPFFTGRAIHYCLEHYYRTHVPLDKSLDRFLTIEKEEMERVGKLWPAEHELIAEQVVLIGGMLDHYTQWVEQDKVSTWCDENLDFVALETEFSVPLRALSGRPSSKVYLAGRFDGLVRRKDDGTYWLWETKTTRSIDELARSLDNDEQAGAYLIAAQEVFNVQVQGVLYNLLRKKVPTEPMVKGDGLLSVNKQIDTTAFAYVRAAKRLHGPEFETTKELNKFILDQYGEFIQSLLDKGNTFFGRLPIHRTPAEMDVLARDLWTVALEMTRESTPLYPSPNWMNCKFCHFRAPCLTMNAGGDVAFVLENEYRTRDPWQSFEDADELINGKEGTSGPKI